MPVLVAARPAGRPRVPPPGSAAVVATAAKRDPGLRVLRLSTFSRYARGCQRFGLLVAAPQRRATHGPSPRCASVHVRGLLERMPQQALGIHAACRRRASTRSQPDQGGNVTWIGLQDLAEQGLGALAVSSQQGLRGRLDACALRIGLPRAIVGGDRIAILAKIHQCIAVGQPRVVVVRSRLEHALHLRPRQLWLTQGAIGAGQVDAGAGKPGSAVRAARSSTWMLASGWSRAKSAAPSNHWVFGSCGYCAASSRNRRSAVAAWPARSAACARPRFTSRGLGWGALMSCSHRARRADCDGSLARAPGVAVPAQAQAKIPTRRAARVKRPT